MMTPHPRRVLMNGVTVLDDNNDKQAVMMWMGMSELMVANMAGNLTLMSLLLQLGANVDLRAIQRATAIGTMFTHEALMMSGCIKKRVRLLLSWGSSFISHHEDSGCSRENYTSFARACGQHELANLLKSNLGGRRCEVVNISSRPELNGKTCVADEYLPASNQYKVTLEKKKSKQVLVLGLDNLKRRDRTPQDYGYYIEFKNGRTIRHDFDSGEECKAFVAGLNKGESQPVVTEEAEARAEQAAAELLAELGLDDSSNNDATIGDKVKKTKKKKAGKKSKKKLMPGFATVCHETGSRRDKFFALLFHVPSL
ncbi:hypothetical protein THAOC_35295 [Thalassiosira oceanica]|uniref:Uncharacterized protein n=1 Tax=Thalassiosira oceanica TaxID=159749 RepID=K0R211_THAOC|nr:hypothetical protein THAOC_35295 [Thalassiosira oceanica]|eukprot:EJK46060.1 hypothetical protein THAOC_35295 [Thalassiosira oceanica]